MPTSTIPDTAEAMFAMFSCVYALVSLGLTILLEAWVLRKRDWGSTRHSLLTSLLANSASALLGIVLIPGVAMLIQDEGPYPYGIALLYGVDWEIGWSAVLLLIFLTNYVLTVVIEGFVLLRMDKEHRDKTAVWVNALVANLWSYLLLVAPFFYMLAL